MDLTLLTPDEEADANQHGWTVAHVYDIASNRMLAQVLPYDGAYPNAEAVFQTVWTQAKLNDPTCIAALKAVSRFPSMKVSP